MKCATLAGGGWVVALKWQVRNVVREALLVLSFCLLGLSFLDPRGISEGV